MADPDTLIKAKIHFCCRERHYHAMQVHWVNMTITHRVTQYAAVEGIKRFSGDPAFKFFYGMALVLEGQLQVVCEVLYRAGLACRRGSGSWTWCGTTARSSSALSSPSYTPTSGNYYWKL